jgi:MFS transporter, ACS family, hexuronate transporter
MAISFFRKGSTVADDRVPVRATTSGIGRYRWRICALLFLATTINYMDRSVLGVLAPTLQYKVFSWTDQQYAWINICFKIAYAIGMLSMGAIIDRFGTKVGYTLSIAIWSIFGMLHAAIRPAFGFVGFCMARFGLGLGESGNFPAAIKTVGEWFPKKERAFATGIFNAGSNVGAILAPLLIPLVVWPDGTNWQFAFLMTGIFSGLWVLLWLKTYRHPDSHPRLSKAEHEYIHSDSVVETVGKKVPWIGVLPLRETWAFSLAKMTDAVWWFYLFWGGKFLFDQFGLSIKSLALPLITIYVLADGGSIMGGWMSSFFIKRGWPINRARKVTLLLCALAIMPVMFVTLIPTKFNANARFFERLQTATYTVENLVTVDGKVKKQKLNETMPAEMQTALRAMEGKSFSSAKYFTEAVAAEFGTPVISASLPGLIQSAAGKFDVNDTFLESIKSKFPEAVVKAVGTLKGQKFNAEKDFAGALTVAAGKPDTNRMEAALMNSARSDNYYWIAVLLIALAAGGHQAWSCNLFTLVSDVFPKKATASVTGIGGMMGAVAGLIADFSLGKVLTSSGPEGYFYAFMAAGSMYLVALGVIHLLMPKMTPLDENLHRVKA